MLGSVLQIKKLAIHTLEPEARVGPKGAIQLHIGEMSHKVEGDCTMLNTCKI